MPFATPAARVIAVSSAVGEDGTITLTNTGQAIAAGETLVLCIGATDADTSQSVLLSSVSDNKPNTWQTPTNGVLADEYVPNAGLAFAYNVGASSAGALTVTATLDETNGVAINAALIALSNVVSAASPLEGSVLKGQGSGANFTLTNSSGALSQDVLIAVKCAVGWFGMPSNTSGWTEVLKVANGSGPGYIGMLVEYQVITSNTSLQGRVDHPDASTAGTSIVMGLFKAVSTGNLRLRITADSATLVTGQKPFTVRVWRNGNPEAVLAKVIAVADVTSAGVILIDQTALGFTGLSLSDTFLVHVIGLTRDTTIIPAALESY